LGDATNVDIVRVEWPSGAVQELTNVAARQFLTIKEPSRLNAHYLAGPAEFYLSLQGGRGLAYSIESSPDFVNWTPLATLTNRTGIITLTNQPTVGERGRFFRAAEF
jgi:hypothetical protein